MKRRTLDIIFSVGGVALAVLMVVLGLVATANANFAGDYVENQLVQQRITFTPADKLDDVESKADCLVSNGGQLLRSGKQAECYANEYIAYHLTKINGGKTYSETSSESRAARTGATQAQKNNDPNAAELDKQAVVLGGKVETLFRGETLRGLLLTSYGFSVFGEKADQAAKVSFLVALVLTLASIAGFIHALRTPREETI